MSSPNPITLLEQVRSIVAEDLGVYRFQSGQTLPAIDLNNTVVARGEKPKKEGLEVIILPYTDPSVRSYLGDRVSVDDVFEIRLLQRDIAKSVAGPAAAIVMGLPQYPVRYGPFLPRNVRLDSLEQQSLLIDYERI